MPESRKSYEQLTKSYYDTISIWHAKDMLALSDVYYCAHKLLERIKNSVGRTSAETLKF